MIISFKDCGLNFGNGKRRTISGYDGCAPRSSHGAMNKYTATSLEGLQIVITNPQSLSPLQSLFDKPVCCRKMTHEVLYNGCEWHQSSQLITDHFAVILDFDVHMRNTL